MSSVDLANFLFLLDDSLNVLSHGSSTKTIKTLLYIRFGVHVKRSEIKNCIKSLVEEGAVRRENHFAGTYRYVRCGENISKIKAETL